MDPAGGAGAETSISAAIARASAGDSIIVHSGTYKENVRVDRRLTLAGTDTGGGRPVVDGGGPFGYGVYFTASNVLVQGFVIRNCSVGVLIDGMSDPAITGITIYDNNIHNCRDAIDVQLADGNNITGNTLSESERGIAAASYNNVIVDNTISGMNETGILVARSGNVVSGNILDGCWGIGIEVLGPANSICGNTARGSKMGIYVAGAGNDVEGNTIYGNDDGLYIHEAYDGQITGNMVYENDYGLKLLTSRNNSITDNTFRGNARGAIIGDDTIDSNTIRSNVNIINGITATLQPPRPTYIAEPVPSGQPSAPMRLVKPSPSAQPKAPAEGAGENVVQIVGTFLQDWLLIGIAVLVLGIISMVILLILFVSWDERRHAR